MKYRDKYDQTIEILKELNDCIWKTFFKRDSLKGYAMYQPLAPTSTHF